LRYADIKRLFISPACCN